MTKFRHNKMKKTNNVGKVFYANSMLIRSDDKKRRQYVVVKDKKINVSVSPLTGLYNYKGKIKRNVVPIGDYPGLTKPTGVENEVYYKTRKGKNLSLSDNAIFDEKEEFRLTDEDMTNVRHHVFRKRTKKSSNKAKRYKKE